MYKLWNKTIVKQQKKKHYLGSQITGTPLLHTTEMESSTHITRHDCTESTQLVLRLIRSTLNPAELFRLQDVLAEAQAHASLCTAAALEVRKPSQTLHQHTWQPKFGAEGHKQLFKFTHPIQSAGLLALYERNWSILGADPAMEAVLIVFPNWANFAVFVSVPYATWMSHSSLTANYLQPKVFSEQYT